MSTERQQRSLLGKWGEAQTALWLRQHGYTIRCAGWHCRFGELDLIAEKGETICFVEVKTRRSGSFALPRESVTAEKQRRLCASAQLYLAMNAHDRPARFDVAEVYTGEGNGEARIDYLENAF